MIEVRGKGIGDLVRGSAIRPTESGLDSEFPDGRIAGVLYAVDAGSDAFCPGNGGTLASPPGCCGRPAPHPPKKCLDLAEKSAGEPREPALTLEEARM